MSRRTPAPEAVAAMIRHRDLALVAHVRADDLREALAQLDGDRRRQVEAICWEGFAVEPLIACRVGECIHPAWIAYGALVNRATKPVFTIMSRQGRLSWRINGASVGIEAGIEIDPEQIPATPEADLVRRRLCGAAQRLYNSAADDLGKTIEALRRQTASAELGVISSPNREHVISWVERMHSPSVAFELGFAAGAVLADDSATEAQRVAASALLESARVELARSRGRIGETLKRAPKWDDKGGQQ